MNYVKNCRIFPTIKREKDMRIGNKFNRNIIIATFYGFEKGYPTFKYRMKQGKLLNLLAQQI